MIVSFCLHQCTNDTTEDDATVYTMTQTKVVKLATVMMLLTLTFLS